MKLTLFLFGMKHRRLSFKYNLLSFLLSQKFKLIRYDKFNHLTNCYEQSMVNWIWGQLDLQEHRRDKNRILGRENEYELRDWN